MLHRIIRSSRSGLLPIPSNIVNTTTITSSLSTFETTIFSTTSVPPINVSSSSLSSINNSIFYRQFSTAAQSSSTSSTASTSASSTNNTSNNTNNIYPRITAINRSKIGSKHSQWARRNGYIPGMIYGGINNNKNNIILTYSKEEDLRKELLSRRTSFLNTLYEIEINGQIEKVLPRDVQLHPFKPKIININWIRYIPGRYPGTKLELPLKAINEERCPALREGGWLLEVVQKVSVYVHGPTIPPYLYMDLRGKQKGEKILASELDLQPGVVLRSVQRDFAVAKLLGSKRGSEEQEEGAAEGGDKAAAKDTKAAATGSTGTAAAAAKPAAAKAPAPAPAKA